MAPILLMLAALAQAPATEDLERAARQLSSDRFVEREEAAEQLWQAGSAAESVLRRAAASGDPEAALRAREILDLHRFGLLPQTPPAQRRHIRLFRDGDDAVRRQLLLQLHTLGELELMVRLIKAVDDSQQRDQLLAAVDAQLMQSLRRLMGSGQWDRAESLLEMLSTTRDGVRHLAAYHMARGSLDQQIERWKALEPSPQRARGLVMLLRAGGEMPEALRRARQADDPLLVAGLQLEMKHWRQLSDAGTVPTFEGLEGVAAQLEELSFLSLIHQLAGQRQRQAETLDQIYALGRQAGGDDQFRAVEALLVNERLEQGMELLEQNNRIKAIGVLTSQFRHAEAMRVAGVEPTAEACATRIQRTVEALKKGGRDTADLAVAVEVAILADAAGMKKQADAGFDSLASASSNSTVRQAVLQGMVRNGRREQAFRHATSSRYSSVLFKNNTTEAAHWYQVLKAVDSQASLEQIWRQVDRLLSGRGEAPDWQALERAVQIRSRSSGAYWRTIGLAAAARGELERAERYYREAVRRKYTRTNRDLGDLLRRQQRWAEAAEAYTAASPRRDDPVDTYLAGDCWKRAGKAEQGEELCQLALLVPLGEARKELGTELRSRGLADAARRCWEIDLRVQAPRSWEHHYAAQQLGNLVDETEPELAADCWMQLTMSTMKAATTFNSTASYVRMPSLILKMRARQALAAEQVAKAEALIERSRRLMPGSISLAEELVPQLDLLEGGRAAGDRIYQGFREHLRSGLEAFPDSPLFHNNLAWLSARCGRRLDEALGHARRAVALAPKSAMYLDTLAEVHYQQGDRGRALELMRRCIEMDPRGSHYRQQLERFEARQP